MKFQGVGVNVGVNESFRHYYIHYEGYVKRSEKNQSFELFQRYAKNAKSLNFEGSCIWTGGEKTG